MLHRISTTENPIKGSWIETDKQLYPCLKYNDSKYRMKYNNMDKQLSLDAMKKVSASAPLLWRTDGETWADRKRSEGRVLVTHLACLSGLSNSKGQRWEQNRKEGTVLSQAGRARHVREPSVRHRQRQVVSFLWQCFNENKKWNYTAAKKAKISEKRLVQRWWRGCGWGQEWCRESDQGGIYCVQRSWTRGSKIESTAKDFRIQFISIKHEKAST